MLVLFAMPSANAMSEFSFVRCFFRAYNSCDLFFSSCHVGNAQHLSVLTHSARHFFYCALVNSYNNNSLVGVFAQFEFQKAVTTLDHMLPESEFAVADSFTLVDILLAQTFNWAIRFQFEVPARFVALRDRHYARPAAQRALSVAG